MKLRSLLPIGSVVLLKEATKRLMICGVYQKSGEGEMHEYIGCLYPEGMLDLETFYLFDHDDIDWVEYFGFVNGEMQAFRLNLTRELANKGILDKAPSPNAD